MCLVKKGIIRAFYPKQSYPTLHEPETEILSNSELAKQLKVIREQYELRGEVENVNTITNLISLSPEKAVRKHTCIRDFWKTKKVPAFIFVTAVLKFQHQHFLHELM